MVEVPGELGPGGADVGRGELGELAYSLGGPGEVQGELDHLGPPDLGQARAEAPEALLVYAPKEWHTTLENVAVDNAGDNLFELGGGNTTRLVRTYAMRVPSGKAGYRIYGGSVTLQNANGIDLGTNADWGVFGKAIADGDSVDSYFRGACIGCNIEDFTNRGIWLKSGSTIDLLSTAFVGPTAGGVIAVQADYAGDYPGAGPAVHSR